VVKAKESDMTSSRHASGKEEFPFATFSFFSALFLPYLEMPLANFCKLFLPNSQKVAKVWQRHL
jgi:hypothetical protein